MPRPKLVIPSYRRHSASSNAIVTIADATGSRRDVYLGEYGSDQSIIAYAQALIRWKAGSDGTSPLPGRGLTVNQLILAFWRHAEAYYGPESKELVTYRYALRHFRRLFGSTEAAQFGPKSLQLVRERMIDHGWCRPLVNKQVNRIRRLFKWAVAEELVGATVLQALQSVRGLARGRCRAPEPKPIRPVADEDVQATLPFLSPTVQAMVQFQRWTGCRPGEVVQLRTRELDRTQDIWVFRPLRHKTQWVGKEKVIAVGPKAQAAIAELLADAKDPDTWLFSPKRAAAERAKILRERRKTRVQPSQQNRRVSKPRKTPGDCYTTLSCNRAVAYAIERATRAGVVVNHWHVNQLRHTRATELRHRYGIESAASVLGHSELRTTEIYAEKSVGQAIQVARECG